MENYNVIKEGKYLTFHSGKFMFLDSPEMARSFTEEEAKREAENRQALAVKIPPKIKEQLNWR